MRPDYKLIYLVIFEYLMGVWFKAALVSHSAFFGLPVRCVCSGLCEINLKVPVNYLSSK